MNYTNIIITQTGCFHAYRHDTYYTLLKWKQLAFWLVNASVSVRRQLSLRWLGVSLWFHRYQAYICIMYPSLGWLDLHDVQLSMCILGPDDHLQILLNETQVLSAGRWGMLAWLACFWLLWRSFRWLTVPAHDNSSSEITLAWACLTYSPSKALHLSRIKCHYSVPFKSSSSQWCTSHPWAMHSGYHSNYL